MTRYGHRYCMALLDVDHFKSYNDTYGHQAGDQILQTVAAQLKAQARGGDALYRYGGEEFLCIFPEQSLATGTLAVERMRIGSKRWPSRTPTTRSVCSRSVPAWRCWTPATPGRRTRSSRKPTRPCTGPSSWAATASSNPSRSPPEREVR